MNTATGLGPVKRQQNTSCFHVSLKHSFDVEKKMDGNQTQPPKREAILSLGCSDAQGVLTEQLKSKLDLHVTPGPCPNIPPGGGFFLF